MNLTPASRLVLTVCAFICGIIVARQLQPWNSSHKSVAKNGSPQSLAKETAPDGVVLVTGSDDEIPARDGIDSATRFMRTERRQPVVLDQDETPSIEPDQTPTDAANADQGTGPQLIDSLPPRRSDVTAHAEFDPETTGELAPITSIFANNVAPPPVSAADSDSKDTGDADLADVDVAAELPLEQPTVPGAKELPIAPETAAATESNANTTELTEAVAVEESVETPVDPATAAEAVILPEPKLAESEPTEQKPIERVARAKDSEAIGDRILPTQPKSRTLSRSMLTLKAKIRRAYEIYEPKLLNTRDNGAWSTMHSFLAYGALREIRVGGPTGRKTNAVGWICYNGLCANTRLFYFKDGRIRGRSGPGRQGHEGQFLAMLAQTRVSADYPMRIDGRKFTVRDLIHSEMATCRSGEELTFKLIGFCRYVDIDRSWKGDDGGTWSIPRVVQEELRQPIVGAACGGTHRLYGLAQAVNKCKRSGRPVEGQFRRAEAYLRQYFDYTFRLQNRDGSFSTEYFAGRGAKREPLKRLETTGHIAEWLAYSLPEEELHKPQMVKAINYLANLLVGGRNREWRIGPLSHGLHALQIYDQRALKTGREDPATLTVK